jgi:hypothetical protein
LNLGVRYDLETNAFANKQGVALLRFIQADRPDDTNNLAPRLGFSYSLNDRTVLRGGYGLYYGTVTTAYHAIFYSRVVSFAVENDGRPDFASNPHNGPDPSYESLLARLCTPALLPGCIRRENPYTGRVYGNDFVMPYSHQPSIGMQRQIGSTMAVEADYLYIGSWQAADVKNINLTYNPATGANYPFSDLSRRVAPEWGVFTLTTNRYRVTVHSLQTAFTKRMSNNWQAQATYTLAAVRDAFPKPQSGNTVVPFDTVPDLGGEYTFAEGDQRHRAVFNGIWQLPYGVQLSGLYHFGSGERRNTTWSNADLRGFGTPHENRLRTNGTIVPRNNFVGTPIHRVDMRILRRFSLGNVTRIDGMLEVFNLFNHANYGSFTTQESSPLYGRPTQNVAVAYAPRTLQFGFRLSF